MNKPEKQTVYLPVKEDGGYSIHWNKDKIFNHAIMKEGYFFTPEQLNEYTRNVGKTFLETAAKTRRNGFYDSTKDEQSITNTFEESFKQFEV